MNVSEGWGVGGICLLDLLSKSHHDSVLGWGIGGQQGRGILTDSVTNPACTLSALLILHRLHLHHCRRARA